MLHVFARARVLLVNLIIGGVSKPRGGGLFAPVANERTSSRDACASFAANVKKR